MKYLSLLIMTLTYPDLKHREGQCLVGSLTGEVACSKVTQADKGRLTPDGNRSGRLKAKAGLTVRLTSQTSSIGRLAFGQGSKDGLSDPLMLSGRHRA